MALIFIALSLLLTVVLVWAAQRFLRRLGGPDELRCCAEADVALYRIRRQLDATEIKHAVRRDERRLRRELTYELDDLAPTWSPPTPPLPPTT